VYIHNSTVIAVRTRVCVNLVGAPEGSFMDIPCSTILDPSILSEYYSGAAEWNYLTDWFKQHGTTERYGFCCTHTSISSGVSVFSWFVNCLFACLLCGARVVKGMRVMWET